MNGGLTYALCLKCYRYFWHQPGKRAYLGVSISVDASMRLLFELPKDDSTSLLTLLKVGFVHISQGTTRCPGSAKKRTISVLLLHQVFPLGQRVLMARPDGPALLGPNHLHTSIVPINKNKLKEALIMETIVLRIFFNRVSTPSYTILKRLLQLSFPELQRHKAQRATSSNKASPLVNRDCVLTEFSTSQSSLH